MAAPGKLVLDQDGWHVDYEMESDRPLSVQLEAIESFLVNAQDLLLVDGATPPEVSLHLSWTPREPQDGIILTQSLIRVMARLNIFVTLDTYIDRD
ncbi:hypothetical protein [Nonomuraea wenchangensis]|uniref:hypothetical protein n=1 Tax=Nonomuraea wenchangensis TaxID=568860 RepID=UPI000B84410A|nr:hypothetical protein [Nonomuraea wenchangensis]